MDGSVVISQGEDIPSFSYDYMVSLFNECEKYTRMWAHAKSHKEAAEHAYPVLMESIQASQCTSFHQGYVYCKKHGLINIPKSAPEWFINLAMIEELKE